MPKQSPLGTPASVFQKTLKTGKRTWMAQTTVPYDTPDGLRKYRSISGQGDSIPLAFTRLVKRLEMRGEHEKAAELRSRGKDWIIHPNPSNAVSGGTKQASRVNAPEPAETAAEVKHETADGRPIPTYEAFAKQWLLLRGEGKTEKSTITRNRDKIKNHITPHIGHLHMDEIDTETLVVLLLETLPAKRRTRKKRNEFGVLETPDEPLLGYSAMRDIHNILSLTIKAAIKQGYMKYNPLAVIERPKKPSSEVPKEKERLVKEAIQFHRLLWKALDFNERLYWIFAFYGLRQSERLGICFEQLKPITYKAEDGSEEKALVLTIDRVLNDEGKQLKWLTKSPAGERNLVLPKELTQVFGNIVAARTAELGRPPRGDEYLYTVDGYHPVRQQTDNKRWHKLLERYKGKNFVGHSLRHFAATLCAESGVPLQMAVRIFGWSDTHMATYYTHLDDLATAAPLARLTLMIMGENASLHQSQADRDALDRERERISALQSAGRNGGIAVRENGQYT